MTFTIKDVLQLEVTPALGCTEPVAIALGASAAVSLLPDRTIDHLEVWADPNIYKNGMAVIIPGTGGMIGLDAAAAVGAYGGDPNLGLEVLNSVDEASVQRARKLIDAGKVEVHLIEESGLHIKTRVTSGTDSAESEIKELHNNIISLSLNDKSITDSELLSTLNASTGKSALY